MKSILHFQHVFPLPEHGSLRPYEHPKAPLAKKKNKSKMTKFTYYRSPQGIIKVLFVDDDHYIDQGMYPFTDPSGKVFPFKDIGNIERVLATEAVYIGHFVEEQSEGQPIKLVVKKINQAKISLQTFQVETIDDHFQVIDVGNSERFNQFLKIQKYNPQSHQMSIRVIISQEGRVIDFQFFQREAKLKANKHIHAEKDK